MGGYSVASRFARARAVWGPVLVGVSVPTLWATNGVGSRAAIIALATLLCALTESIVSRIVAAPGREGTLAPGARRSLTASLGGPPLAGIVAGLLLVCLTRLHVPREALEPVRDLVKVSCGWAALNFLPILPFDGGEALRVAFAPEKGSESACRLISASLAMTVALPALEFGNTVPGLVFVAISVHNVLDLRRRARQEVARGRAQLDAAFAAMEQGDPGSAIRLCSLALRGAPSPSERRDAVRLLAYANAADGDWTALLKLLESEADGVFADDELAKYERAGRELRHTEEAAQIGTIRTRRMESEPVAMRRSRSP
jgi:hypothetical protein